VVSSTLGPEPVSKLDFTDAEKETLLGGNAKRILGL